MIEKFSHLAVEIWANGAWGKKEGQAFISARRELYDITDSQYADTVSLIDKLEKGVAYLERAVDSSASHETVEAEAVEYCAIKGCEKYVQSLVKTSMARRGFPNNTEPVQSFAIAPSQAKPEPQEEDAHRSAHAPHIALDNRLWLEFNQVLMTNLQEFDRLARSKRTCASLQRSNFGSLCSKSLENIADFLSREIIKRGHFDNWNGLFEALAEKATTFANEVDGKVQEIAFEAQDQTSRFQTANRQDPNDKYLSFSALGVIAGVGSFLSEMQRNNETAEYANDVDGHLSQAVAPVIEEMLEQMFQASTSFYDAFAKRGGLMLYHDMSDRQDRASALMKNIPEITDPMVVSRALAKAFEEFPFQDMNFLRLVAASSAPDQIKCELASRLKPYMADIFLDEQPKPALAEGHLSTIRKIVSTYSSLDGAKLWIMTDAPIKKLSAFNAAVGSGFRVEPEAVLVYCDDTVFGKGDNGMLISDERIILRIPFDGTRVILLKLLTEVKISGVVNKTIAFFWDGGGTKFTFTQNNKAAKVVFEILERYLAAG